MSPWKNRDEITEEEEYQPFPPGSARDISYQMGRALAVNDKEKTDES